MSVDISKIHPGDEVLIRGTVINNRSDEGSHTIAAKLHLDDGSTYDDAVIVGVAAIVSHAPKPLVAGETVRFISPFPRDEPDNEPWDLLYIDDSSFAFVGRGNHTRAVKSVRDLVRWS